VGWLVKEDENHIVLASAISDQYGACIQIVLKAVVADIVDLIKSPDSLTIPVNKRGIA
jgi:hypothetical protein